MSRSGWVEQTLRHSDENRSQYQDIRVKLLLSSRLVENLSFFGRIHDALHLRDESPNVGIGLREVLIKLS